MEMDTVAHLKEGHGFGEPLGGHVSSLDDEYDWLGSCPNQTHIFEPQKNQSRFRTGNFDREKWRNKLELFIRKIGETRGLVQCI